MSGNPEQGVINLPQRKQLSLDLFSARTGRQWKSEWEVMSERGWGDFSPWVVLLVTSTIATAAGKHLSGVETEMWHYSVITAPGRKRGRAQTLWTRSWRPARTEASLIQWSFSETLNRRISGFLSLRSIYLLIDLFLMTKDSNKV